MMSDTTSPRFVWIANRSERSFAGAKISECGVFPGTRWEMRQEKNGVSLTPSSPAGDNSFCNNKYV